MILVPVFIFMTIENINWQKEQTTRLLVEKGAALIRSFEAGARTGIGLHWGGFQLQKLLMETAEQPDIEYLIMNRRLGNNPDRQRPPWISFYTLPFSVQNLRCRRNAVNLWFAGRA